MAVIMSHSAIGLNVHSASPSPGTAYPTSPVIIAFMLCILICFIVGFCCIYMCRCCFMTHLYAWAFNRPAVDNLLHQIHSPAAASSPIRGLDPALLQIFPTFPYSSVKEFQGKNNKYSLECAICLLEFEEDSFLRLLTFCRHVFHQECIDLWLKSHKTCPVCRTDLDSSSKKEKCPDQNQTIMEENDPNNNNETRIDVLEEEEEGEEKRFKRSHSTGHSIVVIKGGEGRGRSRNNNDGGGGAEEDDEEEENEDKYTLKLPDHVEMKLIRGHILASKSCSSFGEMARICDKYCYAEAISGSTTTTTTSSRQPLRV